MSKCKCSCQDSSDFESNRESNSGTLGALNSFMSDCLLSGRQKGRINQFLEILTDILSPNNIIEFTNEDESEVDEEMEKAKKPRKDGEIENPEEFIKELIMFAIGYPTDKFISRIFLKFDQKKEKGKFEKLKTALSIYLGDFNHFFDLIRTTVISSEVTNKFKRVKLIRAMLLVRGKEAFIDDPTLLGIDDIYTDACKRLAHDKNTKIKAYHQFISMSNMKYNKVIKSVVSAGEEQKDKWKFSSFEYQISEFLIATLKMNSDSKHWLASLSRISQGDANGFNYISKKMEISLKSSNMYKACIGELLNSSSFTLSNKETDEEGVGRNTYITQENSEMKLDRTKAKEDALPVDQFLKGKWIP